MSHPLVAYVEDLKSVSRPKKLDADMGELARSVSADELRSLSIEMTWILADVTEAVRVLIGATEMAHMRAQIQSTGA